MVIDIKKNRVLKRNVDYKTKNIEIQNLKKYCKGLISLILESNYKMINSWINDLNINNDLSINTRVECTDNYFENVETVKVFQNKTFKDTVIYICREERFLDDERIYLISKALLGSRIIQGEFKSLVLEKFYEENQKIINNYFGNGVLCTVAPNIIGSIQVKRLLEETLMIIRANDYMLNDLLEEVAYNKAVFYYYNQVIIYSSEEELCKKLLAESIDCQYSDILSCIKNSPNKIEILTVLNSILKINKKAKLTENNLDLFESNHEFKFRSHKDLNILAKNNGFNYLRSNGDHAIFSNNIGKIVIIPQRAIGKGLQIKILKQIKENSQCLKIG